jgi:hypothetical protein
MIFVNQLKEGRARAVVANPAKFEAEGAERKALDQVNARGEKLNDEDKVVEVYKLLGGVLAEGEPEEPKAKKAKKSE